ncbi:MAG: hypothetical protein QOJ59_3323 [Thermomicrobiales bacterium]|nr:hypothetical protein [Thermomicrobiales bacterium]
MTADRDSDQLDRSPDSGGRDPGQGPHEGSPHDAVGAYVLDALPDQERAAFETHLATCEACRREVGELAPVVALLPRLLELDLPEEDTESGDGAPPLPSPDLRDRIVEAARADGRTAVANVVPAEPPPVQVIPTPVESPFATQEPISFPPPRPRGRIRGGVARGPRAEPASPWETIGRVNRSWLTAAALAIVAVSGIIWALALQGRVDDKNREIAALQEALDDSRSRANASAWHLGPGTTDQANPNGTLLYALRDETVVLVVRNMPALPSGRVYQTWLIRGSTPEPGTTFTVDDQGTGVTLVDPDAPTYDGVALTEEPRGGSEEPTSPILLQGQLGGARGAIPGTNIAAVQLAPPDANQPK